LAVQHVKKRVCIDFLKEKHEVHRNVSRNQQGTALKHCPKELQEDPSLQLAAVEAGGPQGSAALEPWQQVEQIRLIFKLVNRHIIYLYIHIYTYRDI